MNVFNSQTEKESQIITHYPRRPLLRRLGRLLIVLAVGYYLCTWHLQKNTLGRHSPSERIAEKAFLSVPNAESALKALRQYAGQPHYAGTDRDFETAEFFLSHLQDSLGIPLPKSKPIFDAGSEESQDATRGIIERDTPSAWIDVYYPVMSTPSGQALQIIDGNGKIIWDADLKEHAPQGDDKDPDAARYADTMPAFHSYSVSGDVTGHLVYGNYCTKDDYDDLIIKGAPLNGSIMLCRYGAIVRGLKIKGGQENGAVGVLIYSDPHDDGSVTVENGYAPYPDGPARNPTSIQRGSVQFVSTYPGDPTTPGYPSYKNSTRTEGTNIPSIPSLPISWNNAQHLFQVLNMGSLLEGKQVRLFNGVDADVIPIWNVIGVIPGHIKDEVVLTGNHRDAWGLGAADPSSGTACVHEVIRGFGHLLKKGWKPLRTIVIASWDAEEDGLIGSTEWGEDFSDWIDRYVIAYFNVDGSVDGSRFAAEGSPLLAHFIRDTAKDIPHPTDRNRTLWDARFDDGIYHGIDGPTKGAQVGFEAPASVVDDLGIELLGSGSDFTVFLHRNGIPCTNEAFFATLHDPIYHYHSVYDTVHWQEKYGGAHFSRHIAIAQHLGLQIMRFASTPVHPFNTTHYALQLEDYLDAIASLPETKVLDLDLGLLRASLHRLQKASRDLDEEKHKVSYALGDMLKKWWRHHHHNHRKPGVLRKLLLRIKALAADYSIRGETYSDSREAACQTSELAHFLTAFYFEQEVELKPSPRFSNHHSPGSDYKHGEKECRKCGKKWSKALIRMIHHINSVNGKLRAFERGLISKEGISSREWYRHLGVAPGRWLGYDATTFPGLTEAIVIDSDKRAAEHEAKRLVELIEGIVNKVEG